MSKKEENKNQIKWKRYVFKEIKGLINRTCEALEGRGSPRGAADQYWD